MPTIERARKPLSTPWTRAEKLAVASIIVAVIIAVIGWLLFSSSGPSVSTVSAGSSSTSNNPACVAFCGTTQSPAQRIESGPAGAGHCAAESRSVCVELRTTGSSGPRSNDISTKPNSALAIRVEFVNQGPAEVDNVVLKLQVPDQFARPLPGSTRIWNWIAKQGGPTGVDDLGGAGINVGDYAPGGNVYLEQLYLVGDVGQFSCGTTGFTVTATATTGNAITQDAATARVEKSC